MTKTCFRCKESKPLSEFGVARGKVSASCRPCVRAYGKRHYAKNKNSYAEKARRWELKQQAFIRAVKDVPCADCGKKYHHVCMDFDHRLGSEKSFNISLGHKKGMANVLAEIAKCDVVCANCHRIRTFNRVKRTRRSNEP